MIDEHVNTLVFGESHKYGNPYSLEDEEFFVDTNDLLRKFFPETSKRNSFCMENSF